MAKFLFTEEEKERIREAVQDAEKETCGEIVPYFVNSSDDYNEASWYLSTIFGMIALLAIGISSYLWLLPFRLTPLEISLFTIGVMIAGFLIPVFFSPVKKMIISKTTQTERVQTRAMDAFLQEKVFETEERVGILIFISRLEHQVVVLGDKGINDKVKPEDWEQILSTIIKGIKENRIADGVVRSIEQSKEMLLENGFVRKSTDYNELSDDLRIEE